MAYRQLEFTQEIADIICDRLMNGENLKAICSDSDMPSRVTVLKWVSRIPSFAIMYARAREEQADSLFDDCLNIADESRSDDGVQRAKLRIDTRKWMAGKMRPKKYGDMVGREPAPEDNKESVIRVEGALPGEFDKGA